MGNTPTEKQDVAQSPVSQEVHTGTDPLAKEWSWGAFILDPFFILAVRKYLFLLLYLLYFIPLLNFIAMIGIKIFLGIKGTEMVKESKTFANDDERRGFLKAINHAGFVFFIIALIFIVLGFTVLSLIGFAIFRSFS